jgi:N-acetylmuramate 1-kinase
MTPIQVASLLKEATGSVINECEHLAGGASDRWFCRIGGKIAERHGQKTLICMGVDPALWEMIDSFLRNREFLSACGIPVPETYAEYAEYGIALIEDLGDIRVLEAVTELPHHRDRLYERVIGLLVRMHRMPTKETSLCPALGLHFDVEKYLYEFGFHVDHWVLDQYCSATLSEQERSTLDACFLLISETLASQPRVFTHRDFQSTNIMVEEDGALGLIDFQDARQGLRQYDLASLLWDSYIDLSPTERDQLVVAYQNEAGLQGSLEEFNHLLHIAAIQRKLHDAGAFVYTAAHRGKTTYLDYVNPAISIATSMMAEIPDCRDAADIIAGYAAGVDTMDGASG